MKFVAVCAHGLGTSFIIQMNIEKALKELGINGVEVEHNDLTTGVRPEVDAVFATKDLSAQIRTDKPTIFLDSIIDYEEIQKKVKEISEKLGLI